jgi:UDP-N-acetylglucosamine 1-carboxyvinyltransferase
VHGVGSLGRAEGVEYRFAEDFHEAVTFMALGAITGGCITVKNSAPEQFPLIDRTFAKFGVQVVHENGWSHTVVDGPLRVKEPFTKNILPKIEAAPWPYLPVDLLPIFVALGVRAEGNMMYWNKVYEGAMGWTSELSKFGAHAFQSDPHRIITFGGKPLAPAEVESPYIIRVAIALLMLATSIPGKSVIKNATPVRRAHPRFAENITKLGAQVDWVEGD